MLQHAIASENRGHSATEDYVAIPSNYPPGPLAGDHETHSGDPYYHDQNYRNRLNVRSVDAVSVRVGSGDRAEAGLDLYGVVDRYIQEVNEHHHGDSTASSYQHTHAAGEEVPGSFFSTG